MVGRFKIFEVKIPTLNFARNAKLGWGTLLGLLSRDSGHLPFSFTAFPIPDAAEE